MSLLHSFLAQPFERYLTPSERTHNILAAMGVMTETTDFEKMVAEHVLEVAMGDLDFWLMDVSVLWLDCLALQLCQALFLSLSLPPKPRCLRHLKLP